MAKIIKIKSLIGLRLHKREASKLALKILSTLDDYQDGNSPETLFAWSKSVYHRTCLFFIYSKELELN